MILKRGKQSLCPMQGTPCSCITINRGRGLEDNSSFANNVARVGNKRKENERKQESVEKGPEAKRKIVEERR